jgi:hypothetical protein
VLQLTAAERLVGICHAAHARHTFDVEARDSTCQDDADYSFESSRRCDCNLSNAEILARDARAQTRKRLILSG